MTVVVDASVSLAWCFEDEASADVDTALDRVGSEGGVAPSIWALEVANGLRTAERRGRISQAEVARLRQVLGRLPIEILPVSLDRELGEVSELARQLELTAYDAAYVELAASRGLAMATADGRIAAACERIGVALVSARE